MRSNIRIKRRKGTHCLVIKMASFQVICLILFLSPFAFHSSTVDGSIIGSMYINWGSHHSTIQGDYLPLVLDQSSGTGAQSQKAYLFGSFEMQIKFVPGNSAGTVTAYYLSSTGNKHDEVDFEFLGNSSGQPYTIHTNVYTQGVGGKEQQFCLWFDPTADYHNYTIHWNSKAIVWYVDGVPLRVFRNYHSKGIPYPNQQGMRVYTSLWDADNWATRGGLVKTDWKRSPFIARVRNFRPRACTWNGPLSISQCAVPSPGNWWTSPAYSQLSFAKRGQMNWIRKNYMTYDYCKDTKRFNGLMPAECSLAQY